MKRKDNVWRRRDDGTIEIELTQGQVALIDERDFDKVHQYRWCAHHIRWQWYAINNSERRRGGRPLRMHRFILDAPAGMEVDHINGNGLDNRRANLRLATRSQNHANKSVQRNKTSSRYKGVYYRRRRKKPWYAQIGVRGRRMFLGYFGNEEEAARVYNRAALEHFGEFARLNQI